VRQAGIRCLLIELLALFGGLVLNVLGLLVEPRLDLRLGLGLRLSRRHPLRFELCGDLLLLLVGLLLGLALLIGLLLVDVVDLGLVGLRRLLGHVDADQQRPVRAWAEGSRQPS
jgi:hypothetical protein